MLGQLLEQASGLWHLRFKICSGGRVVSRTRRCDGRLELVKRRRRHEIVIVGGGAAGLELATGLGNTLARHKKARITLVDKSRAHLWKPLLHSVAAGSLDFDEYALDYLAQAHWHHFGYRFGEMIGLDRAHKQLQLAATHDEEGVEITPPRSLLYDTLVIAIGGITNDFGTPG
jgi:NADH dehydrogenase